MLPALVYFSALALSLGFECSASGGVTLEESTQVEVARGAVIEIVAENTEINLTRSSGRFVNIDSSLRHPQRLHYLVRPLTPAPTDHLRITLDVLAGNEDRADATLDIEVPGNVVLDIATTNRRVAITGASFVSAEVATSNAAVSSVDAMGDLTISTTGAAVSVTGHTGAIDVNTTNGNVTYAGRIPSDSSSILNTSSGSIAARLDPRSDVTVRAETDAGSATGEGLVDISQEGGALRGKIGSGSGSLRLSTGIGNIDVAAASLP